MNCPRCTQEIPEGSRFCPACGLGLEGLSQAAAGSRPVTREAPAMAAPGPPASEPARRALANADLFPSWLAIQGTRSPKKPALALTLAFFLGPFTYLYLEQTNWFWWGLLGGILLSVLSRGALIPVLYVGGMLHAWDVACMLNQHLEAAELESLGFGEATEAGG